MKTSELAGAQLDYWVAKAEGISVEWRCKGAPDAYVAGYMRDGMFTADKAGAEFIPFAPSTDWAQAGPIIERNTEATIGCAGYTDMWPSGMDMLPHLMRAYVRSKYGDEVPDKP